MTAHSPLATTPGRHSSTMAQATIDVRLTEVVKRYADAIVLDHVNLEIAHGEFVAILGRSGTGKSTLLNLIGGLDAPTGGTIEVLGQALSQLDETACAAMRARRLGFVFQFFNLIPTLTAQENVELPLALNETSRAQAQRRARSMLEKLGLGDCDQRFPDDLSGGEQQRVAIARAIVHEPAIVLADEPTGNLDSDTSADVLALLREMCRDTGASLIMATHSTEAAALADRVLVIEHGVVVEATT